MNDGLWIFALLVFFTVVLLLQGTVVPVLSNSRKMSKRIQARLQRLADASAGPEFASLLREKCDHARAHDLGDAAWRNIR